MLKLFYSLPLSYVIVGTLFVLFIWSLFFYKFSYRKYGNCVHTNNFWLMVRAILLVFSIFLIFFTTIFTRNTGEISKLVLQPFYSFVVAKKQPEMYRSMIMNIVLFLPVGMSFATILPLKLKTKTRIIITSLLGLLLSALVESIQYFCALGEAWTDDVICNVIGAFCGSLTVIIWKLFFLFKHNYT